MSSPSGLARDNQSNQGDNAPCAHHTAHNGQKTLGDRGNNTKVHQRVNSGYLREQTFILTASDQPPIHFQRIC